MKLYLVRHGDAKMKNDDALRPLSGKGKDEIHKIGSFLSRQPDIQIQTIYHSEKLRAQQTAQILFEHLKISNPITETNQINPLDDPNIWVDRLVEMDENVMLVCHLPYVSNLTSLLVYGNENTQPVKFYTGSMICLKKETTERWAVSWIVHPEDISKRPHP